MDVREREVTVTKMGDNEGLAARPERKAWLFGVQRRRRVRIGTQPGRVRSKREGRISTISLKAKRTLAFSDSGCPK